MKHIKDYKIFESNVDTLHELFDDKVNRKLIEDLIIISVDYLDDAQLFYCVDIIDEIGTTKYTIFSGWYTNRPGQKPNGEHWSNYYVHQKKLLNLWDEVGKLTYRFKIISNNYRTEGFNREKDYEGTDYVLEVIRELYPNERIFIGK